MEERVLMKWFQNPLSKMGRYRIQKAWWRLVASGLHKENRELCAYADKWWDECEKANDEKEEIEEQLQKARWARFTPGQQGYWYVTENPSSCSRLDEKFIEWYEKWHGQVQSKLEFHYERDETKAEKERRHKTHLEDYDERYDD